LPELCFIFLWVFFIAHNFSGLWIG
jgi:hypothetical protein